jgi:uncharacterized BrkB/YihY/UPF0761 family membrane protein
VPLLAKVPLLCRIGECLARGNQLGAALAYYTVFSLAPMVLVLLAVFRLIYGNSEVARREILH